MIFHITLGMVETGFFVFAHLIRDYMFLQNDFPKISIKISRDFEFFTPFLTTTYILRQIVLLTFNQYKGFASAGLPQKNSFKFLTYLHGQRHYERHT